MHREPECRLHTRNSKRTLEDRGSGDPIADVIWDVIGGLNAERLHKSYRLQVARIELAPSAACGQGTVTLGSIHNSSRSSSGHENQGNEVRNATRAVIAKEKYDSSCVIVEGKNVNSLPPRRVGGLYGVEGGSRSSPFIRLLQVLITSDAWAGGVVSSSVMLAASKRMKKSPLQGGTTSGCPG